MQFGEMAMTEDEVEELCWSAIKISNIAMVEPLQVIQDMSSAFRAIERREMKQRCHQWLFEHQQEIGWPISPPNSSGK